MEICREDLNRILGAYPKEKRFSLAVLQDIQEQYRYIPREAMEAAAEYLNVPLAQLYSLATFYKSLSLQPKGKHIVRLCDGTACHIKGSQPLLDTVKQVLGLEPGQSDELFTLETVNCLGACAMAPVMLVDDTVYGSMTPEKVIRVLEQYREAEK